MENEYIRRRRAKELRYKKPVAAGFNLEDISRELEDISEECESVRWAIDDDEFLTQALDSEDEAFEVKMMFSELSADCERLGDIIRDDYVNEHFDTFFARVASGSARLLGYDDYEEDYFALVGFEEELGCEEAEKKLMRLTKPEIIRTAQQCFGMASAFLSIRYRYDYLKSALDVLNGANGAYLEAVKGIEEAYEKMSGSLPDSAESRRFDKLVRALPDRAWLE